MSDLEPAERSGLCKFSCAEFKRMWGAAPGLWKGLFDMFVSFRDRLVYRKVDIASANGVDTSAIRDDSRR